MAKVLYYYNLLEEVAEFKIVCPFHQDINPSMVVNLRKDAGFFHCFGCGASGDAADFVRLANPKKDDLGNLLLYHKILKSKKTKNLNLVNYDAIEKNSEYHEEYLDIAYNYYNCLSMTKWSSLAFEDEQYQVKKYMNRRGFNDDTLEKVKAKFSYSQSYPIIFPMFDNGEFKGWVSRTNNPFIEKKRKYLYNKGFSRKNTLVGDYGNNDTVIVVEGYMDRLKFIQAGYTNVVAILGWKMSELQIKKLKDKGVKYIVSALDNDSCGRRGTVYLRKHFDVIRFKFPENVKDPGEMKSKQITHALKKAKLAYRRLKDVTIE